MKKLIDFARSYKSTNPSHNKAIAYLEQWLTKWRPAYLVTFARLYRNSPTDNGSGLTLKNAFTYFAEKAYQHAGFAGLDSILINYNSGAVLEAFAKQWNETRPVDHFFKYFQQMDSAYIDYRTSSCNVSACAMLENASGASRIKNDDDLLKCFIAEGVSTTNHDAMTRILQAKFGFASRFTYKSGFAELDKELETNGGAVLGILHHGTAYAPYGGGHMIFVREKQGNSYVCGDPYGNLLDGYTSAVENGNGVLYPKSELAGRWTVEGDGSGWARYAA